MATLESLPPDQSAVLQMVLQRGRSYDEIAAMLAIERSAVRRRALEGFDALGPSNSISAPQRALLTDYLLSQLPARVAEQVREQLVSSPPARAWARVISAQISGLAITPLPEIPVGSSWHTEPVERAETEPVERAEPEPVERAEPDPGGAAASAVPADDVQLEPTPPRPDAEHVTGAWNWSEPVDSVKFGEPLHEEAEADPAPHAPGEPQALRIGPGAVGAASITRSEERSGRRRSSSRRGGALLLAVIATLIVAVIVVVIVIVSGGSSKSGKPAANRPSTRTTSTTPASEGKLLYQVNLDPATPSVKASGLAEVFQEGKQMMILIYAQGLPPNTKTNAYAVWLYKSPSSQSLVGFVPPASVGTTGKLQTDGPLPANAGSYKQLLVTIETQGQPKTHGPVILKGAFAL